MLKVLFFAHLKERLDCAGMELQWSDFPTDLDSLQAELCARGGSLWHEVLSQPNTIRAVNHEVVAGNAALADGDEVAFFPPVTGG
jgi:molybdopterin synthase sulfur carrier subunit